MNGRQQVAQAKSRLDATFARAKSLGASADLETKADYAKYLCIQVSGYLERSLAEMLLQHARLNGSPTLQRFVESNTRNFTNAKCSKICVIMRTFNERWEDRLKLLLVDEIKDSIDTLIANRHLIAHGGSVGLTYARVEVYYTHVQTVVELVVDLCDPQ